MNPFRSHKLKRRIAFAYKWALRSLVVKKPLVVFGLTGEVDRSLIEAVYIINLERQPARWNIFRREAHRQRISGGARLLSLCHRVPAVDGKTLSVAEADGQVSPTYPVDAQYYVDPDPRLLAIIREKEIPIAMSPEEIAVALSHVKTWRRIVAENRSYALVLEDDVFFEPQFAAQANRSWQELPRNQEGAPIFDLLYLSFREVERGAQWVDYSPNLRRPVRGYWWLSGYALSNAGARKLLELLPVVGPVDLWMNHRFADLEVYSSPRSTIFQRTDLQSDNRYSILPLLSQIGIQSDKTHLVLEQTKGRRPVVCVGYDQEAAAILETALSLVGYRCCNDRSGLLSESIERLLNENLPLLFDAYIGVESVSRQVERVLQLHPDAVFILAPEALSGGEWSRQQFQAAKERLFDGQDVLLVFDVRGNSGWQSLCRFLRCDPPTHRFPSNKHSDTTFALEDEPVRQTPIVQRSVVVQEHDVHPWIVPYERMSAFGVLHEPRTHGMQSGMFNPVAIDTFSSFDNVRWAALEDSFPSNLAVFRPENVSLLHPQGCQLKLENRIVGGRNFTAASFRSRQSHRYGRFEVSMMPARAAGVVTAFFLHRTDPWQEIDVELLGFDTTKLLINVYFNPGQPGTACNFGNRGTPVVVDLSFDASEGFHRYAIEWEPHEMRWLVDDQLVHVRGSWEPTPIPNLPMELFCSIWPPRSTELAGVLVPADLPVSSRINSIEACEWLPAMSALQQQAM